MRSLAVHCAGCTRKPPGRTRKPGGPDLDRLDRVVAEARRLTVAMQVLLDACTACEVPIAADGPADAPAASWASELLQRADVEGAAQTTIPVPAEDAAVGTTGADVPNPESSSQPALASVAPAEQGPGGGVPPRLGHPAIKSWVLARRQACILRGLRASVSSTLHWLVKITEGNPQGRVMFIGADLDGATARGTTSFAPRGFDLPRIFEQPRAVAEMHSVEMVACLAAHGWPPWIGTGARLGSKRASQLCVHCGLEHASTWVREGVCLGCEHLVRREGRCPFGRLVAGHAKCGPQAWCPHDLRCFVCDGWSCAHCRFHQGDGSDVAGLVASLRPACLFLDFDRTLCSTKGGSPLKGNHSVDDDLVGLCSEMAGRVHVVTRNCHLDDIEAFLATKGLPSIPIHRIKKPRSKAEVVCDPQWTAHVTAGSTREDGVHNPEVTGCDAPAGGLESSPTVLFVDDTIAEHLDPEIRAAPHVVRFLFAHSA